MSHFNTHFLFVICSYPTTNSQFTTVNYPSAIANPLILRRYLPLNAINGVLLPDQPLHNAKSDGTAKNKCKFLFLFWCYLFIIYYIKYEHKSPIEKQKKSKKRSR
jgi:hypothetical protein